MRLRKGEDVAEEVDLYARIHDAAARIRAANAKAKGLRDAAYEAVKEAEGARRELADLLSEMSGLVLAPDSFGGSEGFKLQ